MSITITIEGPSEEFDYHINIIKKALQNANLKVTYNNPKPLTPYDETLMRTVQFDHITLNVIHH